MEAVKRGGTPRYAHNLYLYEIGYPLDPEMEFRKTEDLRAEIWEGCEFKSNYSETVYVVEKIVASVWNGYKFYWIEARDRDRDGKGYFDELVLVNGRIRKLFGNNEDELFVLRRTPRQRELFAMEA